MSEWIRMVSDWAWTLLLGFGAWIVSLNNRIGKLEVETMNDTEIKIELEKLEARMGAQNSELKQQHAELRSEIHNMNKDNSESRTLLYGKLDSLRKELKADFKDLLTAYLGRNND